MSFRPMLAAEYDDKYPIKFPVLVSPKIDGIRCVIRNGQPLTRSLKPIPNRHIRAALAGLPNFDGELVVGDPTDPRAWNTTSSAVMSHDGEPDFTFFVFDMATDDKIGFGQRYQRVATRAGMYDRRIQLLTHVHVGTMELLMELEDRWVSQGFEGLMIRDPDGPYKHGRSTAKEGYLLKMKRFDDLEAFLIGAKERLHHAGEAKTNALGLSERDHKQENMVPAGDLGAFVCCMNNGVEFDVGSGFTAQQRIDFWDQYGAGPVRGPWGAYIRVKHQGFTPDGKPRFPVFMGFRDEKDMS